MKGREIWRSSAVWLSNFHISGIMGGGIVLNTEIYAHMEVHMEYGYRSLLTSQYREYWKIKKVWVHTFPQILTKNIIHGWGLFFIPYSSVHTTFFSRISCIWCCPYLVLLQLRSLSGCTYHFPNKNTRQKINLSIL